MKFIVKLFPEITIKSAPVRKRMNRLLTDNLRIVMRRFNASTKVVSSWDKIEVRLDGDDEALAQAAAKKLQCIPGIAYIIRVQQLAYTDVHDIYEKTLAAWGAKLDGKTFSVRVKRNGDHAFTSMEVEKYVGAGLNQNTGAKGVSLRSPDVTVKLEIRDDILYVIDQKYPGLGGFPLGSQDSVLSLISGGFDSTVASYKAIKRGLRTHYLFFNLGGREHELGVKEIAYYLWSRYGSSHRVKFISVPFAGVVEEILKEVDPACRGVVLKRQMFRAASKIAQRAKTQALVTGEAVAQVSSQTLASLQVIDEVSEQLVLRPLALMDKGEIIDQCRAIGAEKLAANIPEYCGAISVRGSAHSTLSAVETEEQKLDYAILTAALEQSQAQSIDDLVADVGAVREVAAAADLTPGAVVIDIRHPNERALKALVLDHTRVLAIPFYRLKSEFGSLDPSVHYLLYCDKGVMSQLQANHLLDNGYNYVGVLNLK